MFNEKQLQYLREHLRYTMFPRDMKEINLRGLLEEYERLSAENKQLKEKLGLLETIKTCKPTFCNECGKMVDADEYNYSKELCINCEDK